MTRGFQVVQEKSIAYDEHGYASESRTGYIKVDESALEFLRQLKGAPLSFFMCVSLHESSSDKREFAPYTLRDIAQITKFSVRALQYAEQLLIPRFVEVVGYNERGEKLFRPNHAMAWFGADIGGGAKIAPRPTRASGATDCTPSAKNITDRCKKSQSPVQKVASEIVVEEVQSSDLEVKNTTYSVSCVREILEHAGFYGKDLDTLAGKVAPERAERWALWIRWAKEFRADKFQSPAGIARFHLLRDPESEPPNSMRVVERDLRNLREREELRRAIDMQARSIEEVAAEAHVNCASQELQADGEPSPRGDADSDSPYRRDGTADLWVETLGELQLQMGKNTFDTWVRQTHALGWDDAAGAAVRVLVVGVPTQYAKEWLENRLAEKIQRTVTGIVGEPVTIKYIVHEKCSAVTR